jgi:hypothetical protein
VEQTPTHPFRRSSDMLCNEHSNMMEQLRTLNTHFETLLNPENGVLVNQKLKIDRLESFKKTVLIIVGAITLPICGMIGAIIWQKLTGK